MLSTPASAPYTTEAICLKTTNYSDTSKIGTWLSPEVGLIRAIAKGVRGKHRQLAGSCLPLAINKVQFKPGRNLHTVIQSRMQQGFEAIQHGLLANAMAFTLFATANTLAGHQDGETAAVLYTPLVETLHSLQKISENAAPEEENQPALLSLTLYGLQQLCSASGHAPEWHWMVDLNQPLAVEIDPVRFSCALGGVASPLYSFNHEPPMQLTRQTWQCLSQTQESLVVAHPEPAKLLAFYQHFVAHIAELRQPLPAFDFACGLLE